MEASQMQSIIGIGFLRGYSGEKNMENEMEAF